MKSTIESILKKLIHPDTGVDIVTSGIVQQIIAGEDKLSLTLSFPKSRDPFAGSIKRQVENLLTEQFPQYKGAISILVKEALPTKPAQPKKESQTGGIKKVIAIISGKGGVGKSTVTSNLAVALAKSGYKVGVLDADIYGPSQPKMFGVEGYSPESATQGQGEWMVPAEVGGIKIMSIGFFIAPHDALVWRGPMATSALRQLIHQTDWGELDFLLIDMPPGTGDVHLTILQELTVNGALVVSTPQQVAVADAVRAVEMMRSKDIAVPILGVVENMAWFTPAELPENRYYLFGRGGARELAEREEIEFLGDIPIIQSVMDGGESGIPAVLLNNMVAEYYEHIAQKVVEKS